MSALTQLLDEKVYGEFEGNWDDDILRSTILDAMEPDFHCCDYGAGRGYVQQLDFRGNAKFIAGVDPDTEIEKNPFLDEFRVLDLDTGLIDYPDSSFDLVYSDNVLEHVDEPDKTFAEVRRVLKPGGQFIAKTTNAFHYMPLIARFTPQWFHTFYNKLRGRPKGDTFPTRYRVNSARRVHSFAAKHGFEVDRIRRIEGRPEYLRIFFLSYLVGALYEKIVNSTEHLAFARSVLLFELTKKANATEKVA
ncbi:MAG: SAM-dependent methyltransferase [Planctomycetota bacterium]|jgi:SAM-dependent methyltransferase